MSKNLTNKKRLSKVESTRKTFKIFAVSFHGTNLEVMEKEIVKQMEVRSSKKIYTVMVNGTDTDTDGDQTISEATKLEKQAHQIEEVVQKCKKDFDSGGWESLTRTLSEDLRSYWNEDGVVDEDVGRSSETKEGDKSFDIHEIETILPNKIKKTDLQVLNSQIKDNPLCDFFIVIFGKFSTQTLVNLLISNQPLQAIIHFIPCPESDLKVNFPKLHKDIDFLRKSPDTKNVGIFIESLNPTIFSSSSTSSASFVEQEEEQVLQKYYSQQIYDQFTCYLYDIEMLTQQFIVYQTDFVEINDAELPSQEEELLWFKFVQVAASNDCEGINDGIAGVGVFLDNLFTAIENHANLERKNSSVCHLSPFLENNYGKIVVEEANELLRSAVANQLNVVTYWKLVNMVVNMEKNSISGKYVENGIELPEYYELLSWESFVQRLESCKALFDECCHIDMTEECNMVILLRNFHKIVEVKEKFQLPTRLCFRDFCTCIAPELANLVRNFEDNQDFNKPPKFSGLILDDILKELTVSERIFRFENGSISSSVENWFPDEDRMISVRMELFDNFVYLHRSSDSSSNSSKIRIITKNNLCCNIEAVKDQLYPNISIQWPNGCQIRYINENSLKIVEQSYHYSKDNSELKRVYTLEGFVIRYLNDGRIEVLTPNGIIYMLYAIGNTSSYTDFDFENYSRQEEDDEVVSEEIYFVRNLQKYGIYCKGFEVILNDGRKLRMSMTGNILEEISNFLVYEWMDYYEGKKFLDQDDGVKMVWNKDSLKCYYPCGTVITTMVVEDCVRTNFECESNIMDNIFENTSPTFVAKGANKAKKQNSYVTYNLNYLMQHKNYATVEVCGKDKMKIHSPDEFKLILKEDVDVDDNDDNHHPIVVVVLIDIGEELSFRIAAGVCTVLSGVSIPEKNKQIELKLNLFPDATTDILTFQNQNAFLTLNARGQMKIDKTDCELSPYQETLYFLSRENTFGIEFFPKAKYENLLSMYKSEKYFYNSPTQTVLLKSILPIDEQFSMTISSEIEKDLKHFQPVICHSSKSKPELLNNHVFTARVINKLKSNSTNAFDCITNNNFDDTTIGNQLNCALSFFFGEKVKPENPKWKIKLKAIQKDLDHRKQRTRIYNTMMQQNIFPKYFEFKKYHYNVKLLQFVNKLKQ